MQRTAQEIMKEALETGTVADGTEITRLRLLLLERDEMIDDLLALLKEQHEQFVFKVENRTPVD